MASDENNLAMQRENDCDKIRIAGVVNDSVVDGVGFRLTIFTQGCPHHCAGCHNEHTWNYDGGYDITIAELKEMVNKNPLLDGVTLSGGEPFEQSLPLSRLAAWIHSIGENVWCYSGYTYEQLCEKAIADERVAALLGEIDVLIDGRFEQEKLDLKLKFRGSSNQRILDMKKTRAQNKATWLDNMQ